MWSRLPSFSVSSLAYTAGTVLILAALSLLLFPVSGQNAATVQLMGVMGLGFVGYSVATKPV